MVRRFSGGIAVGFLFAGIATSAAATDGAPLAKGEVLLQLKESAMSIEPIGRSEPVCAISASGKTEASARAALEQKRAQLLSDLAGAGIPQNAVQFLQVDMGHDHAMDEVIAAENTANAVAAAETAIAAAGATANTVYDPPGYGGPVSRIIETPTHQANYRVAFQLTSYAQLQALLQHGQRTGCKASLIEALVEPTDRKGVEHRLRMGAVAAARTRAAAIASDMGMKVVAMRRVRESGDLELATGPEVYQAMLRDMGRSGRSTRNELYAIGKVPVSVAVGVDFIIAPK